MEGEEEEIMPLSSLTVIQEEEKLEEKTIEEKNIEVENLVEKNLEEEQSRAEITKTEDPIEIEEQTDDSAKEITEQTESDLMIALKEFEETYEHEEEEEQEEEELEEEGESFTSKARSPTLEVFVSSGSSAEDEEEEEFSPLGPYVYIGPDVGEEEEEDDELERYRYLTIPEYTEPIDREAYLEEYQKLILDQYYLKKINSTLCYKLATYYRRRKMMHAFQEENVEENRIKYEKKLDEIFTYNDKVYREQAVERSEISYMRDWCSDNEKKKNDNFKALQNREKEIANKLIDTKTGKVISDNLIERLISRQASKLNEIRTIRLQYIKRKNKVNSLEARSKSLETIDGKFHLMEYEQLRMENQNYNDKIEERDDELSKLRIRYNNAVQALAHVREKSCTVDSSIDCMNNECNVIEDELTMRRELVNTLKVQRDKKRSETFKLKQESGLLTCNALLLDMEKSYNKLNKIKQELANLRETNRSNRNNLAIIRKNIDKYLDTEQKSQKTQPTKSKQAYTISKVYKGRPSLIQPKLPQFRVSTLTRQIEKM